MNQFRKNALICVAAIAACFAAAPSASAATVYENVTPSDMKGWGLTDTRPGGASGPNLVNSNDGDGSWQLLRNGLSTAKADIATTWNPAGPNKFGASTPLSSLTTWSFEFYRSSLSGDPANQSPALRLNFLDTVNNRTGALVWEHAYQGAGDTPTDTWTTVDIMTANLWVRYNGANYDGAPNITTLANLLSPAGPRPGGVDFTGAVAYGVQGSIGSGIAGVGDTSIDNVTIGFAGADTVISNFAPNPVPEPSVAGLAALGAMGLMRRKRRAA